MYSAHASTAVKPAKAGTPNRHSTRLPSKGRAVSKVWRAPSGKSSLRISSSWSAVHSPKTLFSKLKALRARSIASAWLSRVTRARVTCPVNSGSADSLVNGCVAVWRAVQSAASLSCRSFTPTHTTRGNRAPGKKPIRAALKLKGGECEQTGRSAPANSSTREAGTLPRNLRVK